MARTPAPARVPAAILPFYIYDENFNPAEFKGRGGRDFRTEDRKDGRVVYMTERQAEYFIDQGTLGREPKAKMSAAAATVQAQAVGAGADVIKDDGSKAMSKAAHSAKK